MTTIANRLSIVVVIGALALGGHAHAADDPTACVAWYPNAWLELTPHCAHHPMQACPRTSSVSSSDSCASRLRSAPAAAAEHHGWCRLQESNPNGVRPGASGCTQPADSKRNRCTAAHHDAHCGGMKVGWRAVDHRDRTATSSPAVSQVDVSNRQPARTQIRSHTGRHCGLRSDWFTRGTESRPRTY